MTPEDIEDLFKRTDGVVLPDNGDEDEATLTEPEKQYRIAHLRAVLLEAHNAWVSGSEDLDRIAEKLGDGSRHGESFFVSMAPISNTTRETTSWRWCPALTLGRKDKTRGIKK